VVSAAAGARRQDAELAQPSAFQRFIATSTGSLLPIFGASFFDQAPSTFAPVTNVPVTADYVVGPEDEIRLRVWGQQDFDLSLTVDRNGAVYIPQVGSVAVAGLQFRQLADHLRLQLERVFRNFDLSVNMGRLRSVQVYVTGNVRHTGLYTVSSLSTMVNALFAAGGPSPQGSMRTVQLRRGGALVTELDLYRLLIGGDKTGDVRLQPEDVIYVPPVGAQVAVAGSLKNPAIYEVKDEKTVGEVIRLAGGLSPLANLERATIERIRRGVSREVVDVRLDGGGMDVPVADGDLLQVAAVVPRFDDTVTLRGNVANPGRFAWKPGMRLRDVIPNKEALLSRDYWRLRNQAGNAPDGKLQLWKGAIGDVPATTGDGDDTTEGYATGAAAANDAPLDRDYFVKRNLLATLTPEELAKIEIDAESATRPRTTTVENDLPNINWSYAVIERQNPTDLLTNLLPFDLGKLVIAGDDGQNLELLPGDVVTVFSQTDIRVPQMQQTRIVRLEGEFNAPGVYTVAPGETLGHLIERAGGLTAQAYLFGSEFLRESVRREQQERLDDYIANLEDEADAAAQDRLAGAVTAEETAQLATEISTQKKSARRLRRLRATGRIVLSLEPGSNDISRIAGLTLENGDRFVIPARPSVVNVLGEVYNSNSFIHVTDRRVKEYLELTGGVTRNADGDRMYVVRADGSVVPKQNVSGFEKMALHPGDSVVVPERLLKTTFLRELRSWAQVFSEFGLGVAAINVLR
jgi:protein involved in polysaccharide export with SLBB domain